MKKKIRDTVISIAVVDHKVRVEWNYSIISKKEDSGYYSCFIPGFDMYFTIKDPSNLKERGRSMTRAFFNYHFITLEKNKVKSLGLALHTLGFRAASHDTLILSEMMKNKISPTKFRGIMRADVDPESTSIEAVEELEVDFAQ